MKHKLLLSVVVLGIAMTNSVLAQWSQNTACPGWNNPTQFTHPAFSGSLANKNYIGYKGKLGQKVTTAPNAATATTGITWQSTTIDAANLGTTNMNSSGDCAMFPTGFPTTRAFAIYDTNTQCSGHPANRDPQYG